MSPTTALHARGEDHTGGCRVCHQLSLGIGDLAFGCGRPPTEMNHVPDPGQSAACNRHRPNVVDLQFQRRVRGRRRQGGMDGTSHHRIQLCRRDSSVHRAQLIRKQLSRLQRHHHSAFVERVDRQSQQLPNVRLPVLRRLEMTENLQSGRRGEVESGVRGQRSPSIWTARTRLVTFGAASRERPARRE